MKNINVKLEMVNTDNKERMTFGGLFEAMKEEMETYKKLNMLDELMSQEISVNMYDAEGRIIFGMGQEMIGWLEGGSVLLIGNMKEVYDIE